MRLPESVTITEVGPRDGLQNEDRFVETPQKVELIERLATAKLRRIEAASFVSPKAIPQMRDAVELMETLPRREGVTYVALVPNEVGARNAIAGKVDELATFLSASETHNRHNVNRTVAESLSGIEKVAGLAADAGMPWAGYISTAFACPYEGDVPSEQVVAIATRLREMGAYVIAVGDTIGAANPRQVSALMRTLQDALPGTRCGFTSTTRAGPASPTCSRPSKKASTASTAHWRVSVVARTHRAPPATWPRRTWSTCCTRWASRPE